VNLPEPTELLREALVRGVPVENAYRMIAEYVVCFSANLAPDEWHSIQKQFALGEPSHLPPAELPPRSIGRAFEHPVDHMIERPVGRPFAGRHDPFDDLNFSREKRHGSPLLHFIVEG
jgi:hypothetical protein